MKEQRLLVSESSTFTENLIDAITNASKDFTGGYYSKDMFYTNSYDHALSVAYQVHNAIIEDSLKENYSYQVVKNS